MYSRTLTDISVQNQIKHSARSKKGVVCLVIADSHFDVPQDFVWVCMN